MSQYTPESGENRHKTAAILLVFVGAVKEVTERYNLVFADIAAPKKNYLSIF